MNSFLSRSRAAGIYQWVCCPLQQQCAPALEKPPSPHAQKLLLALVLFSW